MKIERYDMIVIGAGPAGLSAAIEAAKKGLKPIVFDENAKPGGQLFKQIHKFFGSKEHKAKVRGFKIGQELLAEAEESAIAAFSTQYQYNKDYFVGDYVTVEQKRFGLIQPRIQLIGMVESFDQNGRSLTPTFKETE